uniref:Uncharacterized protein n=1 Tax=Arundo donax TaxID=35708 RepID=A0A0A9GHU7_ARUDO
MLHMCYFCCCADVIW